MELRLKVAFQASGLIHGPNCASLKNAVDCDNTITILRSRGVGRRGFRACPANMHKARMKLFARHCYECYEWELPINNSKCSVLPIGSDSPFVPYSLAGAKLPSSTAEKDLGILVTSDLKSTSETMRNVTAASRLLGAIRRSFSRLTPDIFRVLFSSHVPILEYGQPVFYPLTKGEAELLEKVQRHGLEWVACIRDLPYEDRLKRLNLYSLSYRRRRGDLIFTRRVLRGELGEELRSFFPLRRDGSTRGHGLKLYKTRRLRCRLNATLSSQVVNDWNFLPAHVLQCESEESFKKRLDLYLRCNADMEV